jgi:hypothetical protein
MNKETMSAVQYGGYEEENGLDTSDIDITIPLLGQNQSAVSRETHTIDFHKYV